MHTLKVTTIGNSLGVILPKEILAMLNVEKGDRLFVSRAPSGITISTHDEAFARQMEIGRKVMRENRDALRKLAE